MSKFIICLIFNFLILFSIYIIIGNKNIGKSLDASFNKELNQFIYERRISKKVSRCINITCIYRLRKKMKYKKNGYGGHPQNYFFSLPLDMRIIISPDIFNGFIEFLVFIHCRPHEYYERMISRKMYRNNKHLHIIYITSKSKDYNVNTKLKHEAYLYKDILQFNEIASYFNLSIQTVHMLLWACNAKYKYLLKTDVDVYINFPLLIHLIHNITIKTKHFALGKVSRAYVIRDAKYSHYVPEEIIKESVYPKYLQGIGYIIPYNTVQILVKSINYVEPRIWIEDVYMGYVYKYNRILLYDLSKYIIRDLPYRVDKIISNICKYLLIHGLYPIEMYNLNKYYCEGKEKR